MALDRWQKAPDKMKEYQETLDFLSGHRTACVGYINTKGTPRAAGRTVVRRSNPEGKRLGEMPGEHMK